MLLKQRNTKFNWKYLVAFCVFMLVLFIFGRYSSYNLKTNGKFTSARIIKIVYGPKAYKLFKYEFQTIEGKHIEYDGPIRDLPFNDIVIGKYFLVIYDPSNPYDNRVLVTPEEYEEYGLVFPDSLKWILKYTK